MSMSASEFLTTPKKLGARVRVEREVVSLEGSFEAQNPEAYMAFENACLDLLIRASSRSRSGSVWGSTSHSVGGAIALDNGFATFKSSRCGLRFLKQLSKLLG